MNAASGFDPDAGAPHFSVVVPCYRIAHRSWLVEQCLASVAGQTYGDFEVLLVDDGSPDATSNMLAALLGREPALEGRGRVIGLPENGGVCAARNAGIDAARGRFVAFLDFDDLWQPGYLETVAEAAGAHPEVRVFLARTDFMRSLGTGIRVRSTGSVGFLNELEFPDFCAWHLLNAFPVAMGSAIVVERSLFREQPDLRFDLALTRTTAEDILLGFLLLARRIRPRYLDAPLCIHRTFLEAESRGTAAFLRLDEKEVNDYIANRATRSLIEEIGRARPNLVGPLLRQQERLDLHFQVKRDFLRGSGGHGVFRCLRHPRGFKTLLRLMILKWLGRGPLSPAVRRCFFAGGGHDDEACARVQGLLQRLPVHAPATPAS